MVENPILNHITNVEVKDTPTAHSIKYLPRSHYEQPTPGCCKGINKNVKCVWICPYCPCTLLSCITFNQTWCNTVVDERLLILGHPFSPWLMRKYKLEEFLAQSNALLADVCSQQHCTVSTAASSTNCLHGEWTQRKEDTQREKECVPAEHRSRNTPNTYNVDTKCQLKQGEVHYFCYSAEVNKKVGYHGCVCPLGEGDMLAVRNELMKQ